MRILIVDDHVVVREGLKRILADEFPKVTFGEAENAAEAMPLLWNGKWDVMLLDISLVGRSGLDVLKQVHKDTPKLPVLVLTMHEEEQFGVRAIKAGAAGYITKGTAAKILSAAIRQVLKGGKFITPTLAQRLANEVSAPEGKTLHDVLSDREIEVLRKLATGHSVKEIAHELSLSHKTVSTYRMRTMRKMRFRATAELTRYAIEHHLIQ